MVQFSIGLLLTFAGFYFGISKTDWLFQIFAIGLVMSIEGLNTAVEKIADFIHPDYHQRIGFIKDIAAGAVFFRSCNSNYNWLNYLSSNTFISTIQNQEWQKQQKHHL